MSGAFACERGADGVLVMTLDVPGEKVNTLGRERIAEFEGLLDEVERDASVKAVVIRSGKPDNFIAGADIEDFTRIRSAEEGEALSRAGHGVLGRVEACRVPVVAAIHGSCLGIGTELALACRYRVASDEPKTTIGLPEVMLGIVPGAGGTQRLPRLAGLATALDLILTGRALKPSRALRAGLVDELCAAPVLTEVARRKALALAEGRLRPERAGIKLQERLLRPLIFSKARSSVLQKTGGHYPAPLAAIDVVKLGTAATLAEGLALEAREFGRLSVTDVSRALVSIFFATQEIKKDTGVPEGTRAVEAVKLGVLGAGLMGAGIACVAAEAGVAVRMKDASLEALGRGLGQIRGVFEERRKRRSLTGREVGQRMDRISPSLDLRGFARAELVIEAVFEDLELKRRVLAEVEAVVGAGCVVASNTSSIPIGDIARGCRRPGRVLGMHFFSPVHKMPLLEIVITPETEAQAIATAAAFGRRVGKHVIVVRDGPGFYTSRALAAYMNEATRVLEQGAAVDALDAAMIRFGFPVGPCALLDEVGIDVAARVAGVMQRHFGERMAPPASMAALVADGRKGRKAGRGFYTYDGGKKRVDSSVYALLPEGAARRPLDVHRTQQRLVFAFLNESIRCLQEGILRSPRDGDVGAVFGLGFPPFLGGPFRHLDRLGARFALETTEALGFEPAPLLVALAREGRTFHAAGH
ncbi:MAG TPA: 3-hydroxyacyl-CoA dehydrogenase NAD-binding domain-containing protein [Vicinamibacteria bacterium]|nr:3-hydroxyacyl-CoA dehydrogenase NAD-binding domain-containing protein [Vicinamibacteria bacterium]